MVSIVLQRGCKTKLFYYVFAFSFSAQHLHAPQRAQHDAFEHKFNITSNCASFVNVSPHYLAE